MPATETFTLRLGFDRPDGGNLAEPAVAAWVAACERDGWNPAAEVTVAVVSDDAFHQAMDQVVIEVTGQRSRD